MNNTPDILRKILDRKLVEIETRCEQVSLRKLSQRAADSPPPRGFIAAIQATLNQQQPAVIAEIKKASPSKGVLREHFDVVQIAQSYEQNGATCLSVLTDRDFFQGTEEYLQQAHLACQLPILRKDFTIDAYQVYEARAIGADCILLIVAALGDAQLQELAGLADHLNMDVLVEVHTQEELERALALNLKLIGINNRNLHTFETTLTTTLNLMNAIPNNSDIIIVSESGIHTRQDVITLQQAGINTFLVGEAFMKVTDPGQALTQLFF